MQVIAPCTTWVRTFSVTNGLEAAGSIAHNLGLKIAAGAWLSRDGQANQTEINNLISLGQSGQADLLVVGSEVLLRNDMTDTQLIAYINQVKQAVPNVPVTTADVYGVLLVHPNVIAACDLIFANYYAYWEGIAVDQGMTAVNNWQKLLAAISGGKTIVVSEAGWPSAGNTIGNAVPSVANASYFFLDFVSWARANNVPYFYFEAFDEAWKANYEGPQGAHWGILDQNGNLKPGFDQVFNGVTLSDTWDCNGLVGGGGTPSISLTYVPPYGDSADNLAGQVLHVAPATYDVAVYLSVNGGSTWWVKPHGNQRVTHCLCDGTWSAAVVTGGIDQDATNYAAFLIPSSYDPPDVEGTSLPAALYQNSVAYVTANRTAASISGTVQDAFNNPIPGVTLTLSGAQTQTVTTVGKNYSFYYLAAAGPYTVTPSAQNFAFNPPSQSFSTVTGAVTASFVGTPSTDFSVAQGATPKGTAGLGQNVTYTILAANSGPQPATGVVVQDVLPGSVNLISATSDTGTCSGTQPVICDIGNLSGNSVATVTIVVQTTSYGYITNSASVTGDQPDVTPNDNQSSLTTLVGVPVPEIDQRLVPSSAAPSGQGFTLTVNGGGFIPSSVVNWNGGPVPTVFVSSAQLSATISAAQIAAAGTAWLTVVNPSPGATSNVVFFPVTNSTASLLTFGAVPGSPFNGGIGPSAVVVGDFNGDKKLDLAVADRYGSSVTILLGDGAGSFSTFSSAQVGAYPGSLTVSDFNGDGKQDLAEVNGHDGTVTILLGDGTGHFTTASTISAPNPDWVVTGDFNGDGKQDLAVTNQYPGSISILLGNGDGTFIPGPSPSYSGSYPSAMAAGDFNGDGVLDLVVTNLNDRNVGILLGNGDGTFTQTAVSPGAGDSPQSVAVGDFNGDGKLDIAVANTGSNSVTILLGNGDGTFDSAPTPPLNASSPMSIAVGDVNGDGKLDVLVANYVSNNVIVLLGNGDGTFDAASPVPLGDYPEAVAIGDFNGDGRLDFTTVNSGVRVFLQLPSATLSGTSLSFGNQTVGTTSAPQSVRLTNSGSAPLLISSITTAGLNAGDFAQTNNCGSSVAGGMSCTISTTFSPTQTGIRTASITITDNGAGSPQSVALSGTGVTTAAITSPPNGSTLSGSTVTFSWTAGTGIVSYQLWVGSTPGAHDIAVATTTGLAATVSNLPTNGSTLYVRLYSYNGITWTYSSYTYTAASITTAAITSPANGSTLSGSTVTFSWTAGTGIVSYQLWGGSTPGAHNIAVATTTGFSATVSNLPTNGSTLYVRLYSYNGSTWTYSSYTYTAASITPAAITSPPNGSTLSGSTVTFSWTAGTGIVSYQLWVGSTPGAHNIAVATTTGLAATVSNLPTNGSTLYVRLYSYNGSTWTYSSYTYTAF